MFEGFETAGCLRVEIVNYGFVRARQVTSVTLRGYYAGRPPREHDIDLDVHGINYESLMAFVAALNAQLARQRGP